MHPGWSLNPLSLCLSLPVRFLLEFWFGWSKLKKEQAIPDRVQGEVQTWYTHPIPKHALVKVMSVEAGSFLAGRYFVIHSKLLDGCDTTASSLYSAHWAHTHLHTHTPTHRDFHWSFCHQVSRQQRRSVENVPSGPTASPGTTQANEESCCQTHTKLTTPPTWLLWMHWDEAAKHVCDQLATAHCGFTLICIKYLLPVNTWKKLIVKWMKLAVNTCFFLWHRQMKQSTVK